MTNSPLIPINQARADMIESARILVVDDMEVSRLMLEAMFIESGFHHITSASGGNDALELIKSQEFDLVLLDLYMPDIDGLAVCECIRNMHLTHPPVVILQTASTDSWHKVKAFEAGAADYVSKPVDAHELIMRSIIHLERRFLRQHIDQQRERILSELAAAAEIQYQLLPSANKISNIAEHTGVEIASHVQFSSELGGDLWGIEHIGTHLFSLYTVDFSGHGLKAALNTFRIHAMMQKLPPAISSSILALLNDQLYAMLPTGQYATMFYSVLNMATRTLSYSTAGAPLPLIVRSNGSVLTLEGKGFPLGCVGSAVYEKHNVALNAGDKILIHSDALVEQFSNITEKTIINLMRECHGSAQDIINIIVERIARNKANLPFKDDLTLIALKV